MGTTSTSSAEPVVKTRFQPTSAASSVAKNGPELASQSDSQPVALAVLPPSLPAEPEPDQLRMLALTVRKAADRSPAPLGGAAAGRRRGGGGAAAGRWRTRAAPGRGR